MTITTPPTVAQIALEWHAYWTAGRKVRALYRFRDRGGTLLYLGQSSAPHLRHAQHADKPWWPRYLDGGTWEVDRRRYRWLWLTLYAERRAIRREYPRFNIQHNERNPHRVAAPAFRRRSRRRWTTRRRWAAAYATVWTAGAGGIWWEVSDAMSAGDGALLGAAVATAALLIATRRTRRRRWK